MKSGTSGEVKIFGKIPNIRYYCPGKHPFIMSRGLANVHYDHAAKALNFAREALERGTNIVIGDEILDTIIFELLPKEQILAFMEKCKKNKIELVMTGRSAPPELIEFADYVTEFVHKKHPYYSGMRARKGIEY
jgi:cob(I)alamin adenosyltransferase